MTMRPEHHRDVRDGVRYGIDLGGTKIELIALDPEGRELLRRRTPTPREDYAATIEAMATLLHGAEVDLGVRGSLGVGTPGAVSRLTGRMKNCNSTWLNGQPLRQDLERRLDRPVRVSNDANCFALSEASDGAAAGAEVVFGVILGTGCGAGVVVRGQVLTGPTPSLESGATTPCPGPGTRNAPARTAIAASTAVWRPGCPARDWPGTCARRVARR